MELFTKLGIQWQKIPPHWCAYQQAHCDLCDFQCELTEHNSLRIAIWDNRFTGVVCTACLDYSTGNKMPSAVATLMLQNVDTGFELSHIGGSNLVDRPCPYCEAQLSARDLRMMSVTNKQTGLYAISYGALSIACRNCLELPPHTGEVHLRQKLPPDKERIWIARACREQYHMDLMKTLDR